MSKNIKEQKQAVFGSKSQPAPGPMREKHMEHLKDFVQRRYGLELHPSGGKWDEKAQSRRKDDAVEGVDKPDWRSGRFEAQASPDAVVHEAAHLEIMPEGHGLADGQRLMDQQYAHVQQNQGYMKQKQSSHEIQPQAAENPVRRRAGLPPVHRDVPVKPGAGPRMTVDTNEPAGVRLQIGDKMVDQAASSRLLRPENKDRIDMIDRGELRYNAQSGWNPGEDINSKINQRARTASHDEGRKDAKTLMRSDKAPIAKNDTKLGKFLGKAPITGSSNGPSQKHIIFSMENPAHGKHEEGAHDAMVQTLKSHGAHFEENQGQYGGAKERSITLHNPDKGLHDAVVNLLQKQGQESYIVSNGQHHKMKFLNGENAGKHIRGSGVQHHEQEPQDNFTKSKDGKIYSYNFDFSKIHD